MTIIRRSISEVIRQSLDWRSTWQSEDQGLIKCWEAGRKMTVLNPELAEAAQRGELPVTYWKGGVSRTLKKLEKYGALQYLALWQGLRGENLEVNQNIETTIVCSKTGMQVTFTPDTSKLINQTMEESAEGVDANGRLASGVPEQSLFP